MGALAAMSLACAAVTFARHGLADAQARARHDIVDLKTRQAALSAGTRVIEPPRWSDGIGQAEWIALLLRETKRQGVTLSQSLMPASETKESAAATGVVELSLIGPYAKCRDALNSVLEETPGVAIQTLSLRPVGATAGNTSTDIQLDAHVLLARQVPAGSVRP